MASFTTAQTNNLNNSMSAAQDVALGTLINDLVYGGISDPAVGTITSKSTVTYTVAPAVGSATATKAALLLTVGAQTGVTAGITQPDVPRILTVKGNDANVTGNVVISGTNINGVAITDTIAASGSSEVVGTKAFKTVTSINYPAYAVAGTESISIGRGVKIGFPVAIPNAALVIAKSFDGAADGGTVTAAATVEGSIYAVAGTMNAAKLVELTFLV